MKKKLSCNRNIELSGKFVNKVLAIHLKSEILIIETTVEMRNIAINSRNTSTSLVVTKYEIHEGKEIVYETHRFITESNIKKLIQIHDCF